MLSDELEGHKHENVHGERLTSIAYPIALNSVGWTVGWDSFSFMPFIVWPGMITTNELSRASSLYSKQQSHIESVLFDKILLGNEFAFIRNHSKLNSQLNWQLKSNIKCCNFSYEKMAP